MKKGGHKVSCVSAHKYWIVAVEGTEPGVIIEQFISAHHTYRNISFKQAFIQVPERVCPILGNEGFALTCARGKACAFTIEFVSSWDCTSDGSCELLRPMQIIELLIRGLHIFVECSLWAGYRTPRGSIILWVSVKRCCIFKYRFGVHHLAHLYCDSANPLKKSRGNLSI